MDDQQVNCMFNAMAKCQSDHLVRHNDVPAEDRARSFLLTQNYASENPQGFQVYDASCIDEGKSLFSKPQHDCQSFALDTMRSLVEPAKRFVDERISKDDIVCLLQRIYEDVIDPLYFVASAGGLDECIKLSEFATSLLDILRRHNILGPESDPRQELNSLLNKGRETVLKDEIQPETVVTGQANENDVWEELAVKQVPDDSSMECEEEEPVREKTSKSVLQFTEHFNKHGGSIATHSPPLVTNFSNSDVGSVVADMETECSVGQANENDVWEELAVKQVPDDSSMECEEEEPVREKTSKSVLQFTEHFNKHGGSIATHSPPLVTNFSNSDVGSVVADMETECSVGQANENDVWEELAVKQVPDDSSMECEEEEPVREKTSKSVLQFTEHFNKHGGSIATHSPPLVTNFSNSDVGSVVADMETECSVGQANENDVWEELAVKQVPDDSSMECEEEEPVREKTSKSVLQFTEHFNKHGGSIATHSPPLVTNFSNSDVGSVVADMETECSVGQANENDVWEELAVKQVPDDSSMECEEEEPVREKTSKSVLQFTEHFNKHGGSIATHSPPLVTNFSNSDVGSVVADMETECSVGQANENDVWEELAVKQVPDDSSMECEEEEPVREKTSKSVLQFTEHFNKHGGSIATHSPPLVTNFSNSDVGSVVADMETECSVGQANENDVWEELAVKQVPDDSSMECEEEEPVREKTSKSVLQFTEHFNKHGGSIATHSPPLVTNFSNSDVGSVVADMETECSVGQANENDVWEELAVKQVPDDSSMECEEEEPVREKTSKSVLQFTEHFNKHGGSIATHSPPLVTNFSNSDVGSVVADMETECSVGQANENDVWEELAVKQVPDDSSMECEEEEPVREKTSKSVLQFTEHFNKHGGSIATHSPPLVTNFSNSDVGSVVADMETECSVGQANENDVWEELAVKQVPDDSSMECEEEEPVREKTSKSVLQFTEHFNKHGGSIATHSPPLVTNFSNSDVGSVVADMETEFSVFPSSNPTFSSLLILDNQHLSCSTENKIPLTVEELASTVSDDDDDVGNPKRARRGKGQKRVGRRLKEQIN